MRSWEAGRVTQDEVLQLCSAQPGALEDDPFGDEAGLDLDTTSPIR